MQDYTLSVERDPSISDTQFLLMQMKPRPQPADQQPLAVFLRDAQGGIVGGVYGWLAHGWLFVDTLFVDEKLRGQDYGTRLMDTIEGAAAARGIQRCFLVTMSFQARPFYEKRGFRVEMTRPEFFPGVTLYFMVKHSLVPSAPTGLDLIHDPAQADVLALDELLVGYNNRYTGPVGYGERGVFLRDHERRIIGGLAGWLFGPSFSIEQWWLPAALAGYWPRILAALEAELASSGAALAQVRVAGRAMLPVLEAAGYRLVGAHEDYPAGSATYYIEKPLR